MGLGLKMARLMTPGARIPLESLTKERVDVVLCYPTCSATEVNQRLMELRKLEISAIEFSGERRVGRASVLGKGCVGVVVKAWQRDQLVALKIRRTDANRSTMQQESLMLEAANSVKVGPRLLGVSQNFLVMEFVDGCLLQDWIPGLGSQSDGRRLRHVLRQALEQAWRLDEAHLDHGELSNASKHLMVRFDDAPILVDFETASKARQTSNVTSLCQFLFIGSGIAEKIQSKLGAISKNRLLAALRTYKKVKDRKSFERVLREARVE
jgi:putative serine/threonine protein kinase